MLRHCLGQVFKEGRGDPVWGQADATPLSGESPDLSTSTQGRRQKTDQPMQVRTELPESYLFRSLAQVTRMVPLQTCNFPHTLCSSIPLT